MRVIPAALIVLWTCTPVLARAQTEAASQDPSGFEASVQKRVMEFNAHRRWFGGRIKIEMSSDKVILLSFPEPDEVRAVLAILDDSAACPEAVDTASPTVPWRHFRVKRTLVPGDAPTDPQRTSQLMTCTHTTFGLVKTTVDSPSALPGEQGSATPDAHLSTHVDQMVSLLAAFFESVADPGSEQGTPRPPPPPPPREERFSVTFAIGNAYTYFRQARSSISDVAIASMSLRADGELFGVKLGGDIGAGGRVTYDGYIGPTLGVSREAGTFHVFLLGGSDQAALAGDAAWYGATGIQFSLAPKPWFQFLGSGEFMLRNKETDEARANAGVALACLAGPSGACWQFVVDGRWTYFPTTETAGYGVGLSMRVWNRWPKP